MFKKMWRYGKPKSKLYNVLAPYVKCYEGNCYSDYVKVRRRWESPDIFREQIMKRC